MFTLWKKNKGTTFLVIGMMFTTLGLTILSDYKVIQYSALILGLMFTIYSVFVYDRERKTKVKKTKTGE